MSDATLITLPDRETMLERLRAVDDNSHLQERFYPLLTKAAGEKMQPMGVVMLLVLAVNDYVEGMPPMIASLLLKRAEQFIDALIEDEVMAAKAKEIISQMLSR